MQCSFICKLGKKHPAFLMKIHIVQVFAATFGYKDSKLNEVV